jgi:hypothetical protein
MSKKWVCLVSAFLVLGPVWAVQATVTPVGWWKFDDAAGTTAVDSSPNKNNGTLISGATWAVGQFGGTVQLDGTDDYVSLPIGSLISKLTSMTVATWANWSGLGGNWQRVFDFGTGQNVYMFLTPSQGGSNTGNLRFAITISSNGAESQLNAPNRLATGWHHVAVAIDGDTKAMQLYLDGVVVASGTTAVLPNAMGNTNQNWLGRSQWPDAYYQGSLDDVRIFDRSLAQDEIQKVIKGVGYGTAGDPQPADKATDVLRDATLIWGPGESAKAHDVYLGTSLDDVTNASTANKLNVLVSQGQGTNSYTPPAVFEFGKTYYWRVDEVNGTSTVKGDLWSFTVEPYAYPIKPVVVTASSNRPSMGPENTINGSGLTGDLHGSDGTTMWLSAGVAPNWIQYQLDKVYKLYDLKVWNSNQLVESFIGFGAKKVTVEYSADGTTWTALANVPEFAQAPGAPGYAANTTVSFGGVMAKYVKLTIDTTWGGISPVTGLAEVQISYVPVQARAPQPANAATDVAVDTSLSWRAGREAGSHQVFFGTDQAAVAGGTAAAKTVTAQTFTPGSLNFDTTYYWRVDEVNTTTYPGEVWSFTTTSSLVVDDFESYNDDSNRIYNAWIDGLTDGKSGSQVGYDQAPFAEQVFVHGGRQSMPLAYNNAGSALTSEAQYTFAVPQDWSQYGITTLVVWFRGDVNNIPAPLYAKINGTKVSYNNGAAGTAFPLWKQWNINLTSLGISLKSVKTLTIGVGDGKSTGSGMIFIDDIRLYATAPQAAVPANPGTNGLVLLYAMEGNAQDTSGKGNNGTLNGTATYVSGPTGYGKALQFNGLDNYVTLPIGNLLSTLSNITVATWVNRPSTVPSWERIWDFGTGPLATANNYMFLAVAQGTTGPMTFAIMTPTLAEKRFVAPNILPAGWHHTAVVIDGTAMTATVYLDGDVVATSSVAALPKDLGVTTNNCIGRSQWTADGFFNGAIDDFRIYNRAASAAEIRYLAGDR